MEDREIVLRHLEEYQYYPADKDQILQSFRAIHPADREDYIWLIQNLAEGIYDSSDEVFRLLGFSEPKDKFEEDDFYASWDY